MQLGRRERLVDFIEQLLADAEKSVDGALAGGTSLIESGLLDSLAILSLATWIDEEVAGEPLDLESVDIVAEWDSVDAILRFIEAR